MRTHTLVENAQTQMQAVFAWSACGVLWEDKERQGSRAQRVGVLKSSPLH